MMRNRILSVVAAFTAQVVLFGAGVGYAHHQKHQGEAVTLAVELPEYSHDDTSEYIRVRIVLNEPHTTRATDAKVSYVPLTKPADDNAVWQVGIGEKEPPEGTYLTCETWGGQATCQHGRLFAGRAEAQRLRNEVDEKNIVGHFRVQADGSYTLVALKPKN